MRDAMEAGAPAQAADFRFHRSVAAASGNGMFVQVLDVETGAIKFQNESKITKALIEDGRRHLLLHAPIGFAGPVRLLHGQRDPDVPWQRSLTLAEKLASDDVRVLLVKDGDHRLSRAADLALLTATIADLL
jgi:pimeloyl-ACP methyl ester carboxylesterase